MIKQGTTMKPGDKIIIYHDPWTEERPEGEAEVMKIIRETDSFYYLTVVFQNEHQKYQRKKRKIFLGDDISHE